MGTELAEFFERDVLKLKEEIVAFKDEANLWRKLDGINNSAGNLALHIIGGLSFHIGTLLGKTGYERNRAKEFSVSDVPREQIIVSLDELAKLVKDILNGLSQADYEATYPLDFLGIRSTSFYMLQFYGHLNYHLGQVNYLRRILESA